MNEKVLITGGTGFIGTEVTGQLVNRGHEVLALVRDPLAAANPGLPSQVQRFTWPASQELLRALVREQEVTVCVHLAARFVAEHAAPDVADLVAANVGLTAAIADAAANAGVRRLICAGTVRRNPTQTPAPAASLYAATKQAGQDLARYFAATSGLELLTINIPDTYGPGDTRRKVVDLFLEAVASQQELSLSPGAQLLDLIHVQDVAAAFVMATENVDLSPPEEVSLTSGRLLTLRELAEVIAEVTERPLLAQWGALPYRAREFFTPWDARPGLAGWQPRIELRTGIRALWEA